MLIKRLVLQKILSFNHAEIELGQLNVLIGPNAVGKSNLIEVISLLKAAPANLATPILRGGGVRQWLWLGDRGSPTAAIECELRLPSGRQIGPVVYRVQFSEDAGGLVILDEELAKCSEAEGNADSRPYFTRSYNTAAFGNETVHLPPGESVLSQFKNPMDPTPITEVGRQFAQIRIYREFRTGPGSPARYGISTNVPKDALMDGSDNLALVLNELNFLGVHDRVTQYLRRFCERFEDVKVRVGDGIAGAWL